MKLGKVSAVLVVWALAAGVHDARAAEWFVAVGASGSGTSTAPFGRIQQALNVAQPGDTITVRAGAYTESLVTVRSGTSALPIRLRAAGARGTTLVTYAGRVLNVNHAYVTVENLVLDGQYADADTVTLTGAAHYATLRNLEVRRSKRDLIDIRGATVGVLIDGCLIHHALNATGGRTDAHGVVAAAARDLTIRDTEIHTFSGDGFQIDPGRSAPGWDRVTIEGSRIWLAPLPAPENGFAAGAVPGENAVDTKVGDTLPRARITIRDTVAWGFRNGLIGNMAAFNLKENISALVDRVTVYDSEIAFRLRGRDSLPTGAWVTVQNAVIYNTLKAFRYENDIQNLKIWNSTLGRNVASPFQAASSGSAGVEVRNLLMLGTTLPSEAAHPTNRLATVDTFVDVNAHNYALQSGAPAVDAGIALLDVTTDRAGVSRPQGKAFDVGAYEWVPTTGGGTVDDTAVVHVGLRGIVFGAWRAVPDASAAGGVRLSHPDAGLRIKNVQPYPTHYFEVSAWVQAGKPYRLWLRGKADANSIANDAVSVQFANSVDAAGAPLYRIGTTSAARVQLQECSTCAVSGWGWQDHGFGLNVIGPVVRFTTTGLQTIRVQTWEDGVSIDQIVLSPSAYMSAPPGAPRNDTTILPES